MAGGQDSASPSRSSSASAGTSAKILGDSQFDLLRLVRFEFLVPAGLLYLLAHCCWATFWVRLLHGQGIGLVVAGLRAYFVSQFGKYVPGKAWVILMRVGMLRHDAHAHPIPVAVTATYETLCEHGGRGAARRAPAAVPRRAAGRGVGQDDRS